MENQDKKLSPKPSDDAQSLVETIIPSTETEESKTTEVIHKISLETPQAPADKKEETPEQKDDSEKEESIDKTVEDKTEESTDKNSAEKAESPENESEKVTDADSEEEAENSSNHKKEGTDEGDKIETVAP